MSLEGISRGKVPDQNRESKRPTRGLRFGFGRKGKRKDDPWSPENVVRPQAVPSHSGKVQSRDEAEPEWLGLEMVRSKGGSPMAATGVSEEMDRALGHDRGLEIEEEEGGTSGNRKETYDEGSSSRGHGGGESSRGHVVDGALFPPYDCLAPMLICRPMIQNLSSYPSQPQSHGSPGKVGRTIDVLLTLLPYCMMVAGRIDSCSQSSSGVCRETSPREV